MADGVHKTMEELKKDFPEGVEYHIVYNTTGFVHESIDAVTHTLFEALILVVIVVVLFLQNWRASIIPLAAVPVSLVGTFAVLLMMGFGLNALTLFGLVLAIGIVVDDAIVVVENVERNIALGLSPQEATRKAMREGDGPDRLHGPGALRGVHPDRLHFRPDRAVLPQFALTIAISTVISAFNSLTPVPGARRGAAQEPRCAEGPLRGADRALAGLAVPSVQSLLRGPLELLRRRGPRACWGAARWRW